MSRRNWNHLAATFEAAVCDVTHSSGTQLAQLVRRSQPSRSKTLVDAGCGIGSFTRRFGRRFGACSPSISPRRWSPGRK